MLYNLLCVTQLYIYKEFVSGEINVAFSFIDL